MPFTPKSILMKIKKLSKRNRWRVPTHKYLAQPLHNTHKRKTKTQQVTMKNVFHMLDDPSKYSYPQGAQQNGNNKETSGIRHANLRESSQAKAFSFLFPRARNPLFLPSPVASFSHIFFFPPLSSQPLPTLCLLTNLSATTSQLDHIPWPPPGSLFSGSSARNNHERKKVSSPSLGGSTIIFFKKIIFF